MIKKIINKIWKTDGQVNVSTPISEKATFALLYKELTIGYLSVENSVWKFKYSEQFQSQCELTPLVDFPDIYREYESTQLWPFFSYRIPGLNQPSVQDAIKREAIDNNNEVALLKKFGKFSVYNPFLLTPSM